MRLRRAIENRLAVEPGEIKFPGDLQRAIFFGSYRGRREINSIKSRPQSDYYLENQGYASELSINRDCGFDPEGYGFTEYATYPIPTAQTLDLVSRNHDAVVYRARRVESVARNIKRVAATSLIAAYATLAIVDTAKSEDYSGQRSAIEQTSYATYH